MTTSIAKKITGFSVITPEEKEKAATAPAPAPAAPPSEALLTRPSCVSGQTYKLKTPVSEAAMYITINDVTVNEGTDHEQLRPFEIFINSKNMEHFQWVAALTRVISAVFRKGGDVTFLVEELQSVFDPKGGYFKKGGKYVPSLVAEIGNVLEEHLKHIGMMESDELDEHQKKLIADKRAEFAAREVSTKPAETTDAYPAHAVLCNKCHTKAVVKMDGCATCLSCGDSKCG